MMEKKDGGITMYSTSWCPDCVRAKMIFNRMKVRFTEIDVDRSEEGARIVMEYNGGKRVVPTIFFPDGSVLVEPSNHELREKIEELGLAKVE